MTKMNCKFTNVIMFAVGAAIGSAVTWKILKDKYERLVQEEIESVKEAFVGMTDERSEENDESDDGCHKVNWDELEDLEEELEELSQDKAVNYFVENGSTINTSRWRGNGYIAEKRLDLPNLETGEATWEYAYKFYVYTTSGEEKPLFLYKTINFGESKEVCISDDVYCRKENGNYYELPENILNDVNELRKSYVFAHMYEIEDVFKIAHNEILFENTFDDEKGIPAPYFKLTINSIHRSLGDSKSFILVGNGFTIITDDNRFSQLDYPHTVIIEGYVSDTELATRQIYANPLVGALFGELMALGAMVSNISADMQLIERFLFHDVELLYY